MSFLISKIKSISTSKDRNTKGFSNPSSDSISDLKKISDPSYVSLINTKSLFRLLSLVVFLFLCHPEGYGKSPEVQSVSQAKAASDILSSLKRHESVLRWFYQSQNDLKVKAEWYAHWSSPQGRSISSFCHYQGEENSQKSSELQTVNFNFTDSQGRSQSLKVPYKVLKNLCGLLSDENARKRSVKEIYLKQPILAGAVNGHAEYDESDLDISR